MLKEIAGDFQGVDLDQAIMDAQDRADSLFSRTVGRPAQMVAQAEGYRAARETTEMARARAFDSHVLAYEASPGVYMMDRWLDVWDEVLPGTRKYVIGMDRDQLEIWLNWERQTDVLESASFGMQETQQPSQ
jgi:hypothetical protein